MVRARRLAGTRHWFPESFQARILPGSLRNGGALKQPLHLLQTAFWQKTINRIERRLGFHLRRFGMGLRAASCPNLHINLVGNVGRTCDPEKPAIPAGVVTPLPELLRTIREILLVRATFIETI